MTAKSQDLTSGFLDVVEQAAIACAHTMGQGDRHRSDQVAVEAMRARLDHVPIDGRIVIGEGERDKAPMLYIGERVGRGANGEEGFPEIDIAVDPLEGTNLCATGAPRAIAVLAASERGGLLHAPDIYMQKLIVGAQSKNSVNLDAPVSHNLKQIARCLDRDVEDLVIVVLDRERHAPLIADIRAAGARIRLIGDGDVTAAIGAAVVGTSIHAVMGSGGAPEGVLAGAAMRCLGGEIFARLIIDTPEKEARAKSMGIDDPHRVYTSADLASGRQIIFAATGVTEGSADEGRAVLRRRVPHELGRHADRSPPRPVHRHDSRQGAGRAARAAVLTSEDPWSPLLQPGSRESSFLRCFRCRNGRRVLSSWTPPFCRGSGTRTLGFGCRGGRTWRLT